jgi:hypothetical protein
MHIQYSECMFVVLGIQHAMHHIILSSVVCLAVLQYFSKLSHTQHDLKKNY